MKKIRKLLLGIVFVLVPAHLVIGGVNLKNGNFYISYDDISMGEQYVMDRIGRTYNSKSTYSGLFGYGWGSKLDTHLEFYPDGTIILREHGGGSSTTYSTSFYDEAMLEEMIDMLLDAAVEAGDISNTPAARVSFREKITNNAEQRANYWDKYRDRGLVEYTDTYPEGTVWENFEYTSSGITKTAEGYRLIDKSVNRYDLFNADGKLIRVENANGRYFELTYDEENRLEKLVNDDGSTTVFTLNEDGRIIKMVFGDYVATLQYEGENLVYSVDAGNNTYRYSYDQVHNMTAIGYEDETEMLIEYYPGTYYTKKITERNGEVTEYEYVVFYNEDGTENKDRYGTRVIKEDYYGNPTENYYEYWIKTDTQGNRYTYRNLTDIGGIRTETYYDEICNMPVKIVRESETTEFTYNNRCLLTEKTSSDGTSVRMKYHETLEKIIWVENQEGITTFDYDDKGNLTRAEDNNGRTVILTYNESHKITEIRSSDTSLLFEYNEIGKPVRIEAVGFGHIDVEYDDYGDITSVKSPEGHEVAMKVTQTFQELLALVKPAGVNLGI